MTVNSYLQLCSKLTNNYLGSLYPKNGHFEQVVTGESEKVHQWSIKNNQVGQTVLTVNVSELSPASLILINLVNPNADNKVENVLLDWLKDLQEVKFPMEEISLSADLIEQFNNLFNSKVDCDELKQLFEERTSLKESSDMFAQQPVKESRSIENNYPEPPSLQASSKTVGSQRHIPDMPGFEDELEIQRPMNPNGNHSGFPTIGDRDLNPPGLPKNPELKPFLDPLGGNSDGGMYPTPNHPLFGRERQGNTSRLGVPPGARFDDPLGEDNLDDIGNGLPGNLRGSSSGGGSFPSFPGGSFGGSSTFGGDHGGFGGGFGF
ncbi:hypothetical protein HYPBUDRAFT_151638 [Hyphopichia burtonii NRRL Y-1933]|uniref:PI31 proteasome regulator C-terminal domain-containing protein n=1 Tax=Hyphopichia burtonii NRRL Y-1933 TaxID=984485 RepID=A0A1E4RSK7_9ASCO|nr:hypothetical protein HYPBUDRAFT_151638 [Hyphopichia burtonii NRRL Y-1933]ODV70228.1 hypothetical protein HYPBUDRAFT_151638 [Hyphopichia burtonii NRRL Y-1933]